MNGTPTMPADVMFVQEVLATAEALQLLASSLKAN
jgi:hypothetical protein